MEMQQMRHFLMAVQYGNLGQASEALNMTQSGLSRSIKALEDSIGLPLLVRTAKGVSLSEYGEILLPHAKAIVNEQSRVADALRQIRQGREGNIRLGITTNFVSSYAPEIIAEFRKKRPNVDLQVVSSGLPSLMQALQLAEIDLILGLFSPGTAPSTPGVVKEELFECRSVVACAFRHDFSSGEITAEELSKQPWALLDSDAFRQAFEEFFTRQGLPAPRQVLRTNSLALLRRAVVTMDLLTILPKSVLEPDIDLNMISVVDTKTPAGVTHAGIAYRDEDTLPPAAKVILRLLRDKNMWPS